MEKEETARMARQVSLLLREYMAVQEDLFKPTLRKIVRLPFFYTPVDYRANCLKLEALIQELGAVKSAIRKGNPEGTLPEGKFLALLRGYVSLMGTAAEKLREICGRLEERSGGAPYSRQEYKIDMAELRQIQKKHLDAGVALNTQLKDLDHPPSPGQDCVC